MPNLNDRINNEMNILDILLEAKAQRTIITLEEYIRMRRFSGASVEAIRADLLADLQEGGRIFGEFRNAIKATIDGAIHRFRDQAEISELGDEQKFRWVAVLINTCPDCLDRHGQVKTWDEWAAEGLPRTGQTVCRENCKCVLLPADSTVLEPVKRGNR